MQSGGIRTKPILCLGHGLDVVTPCPDKVMLVNCSWLRQRCHDCAKKRQTEILARHVIARRESKALNPRQADSITKYRKHLRTEPMDCPGYGFETSIPCPDKAVLVDCFIGRQRCRSCADRRKQEVQARHNAGQRFRPKDIRPMYTRIRTRTEPIPCAGYGIDQLVPCPDQVMLVDCQLSKKRCARCAQQQGAAKARAYWKRHHPNAKPRPVYVERHPEPAKLKDIEQKQVSLDRLEEIDTYFPGRGELMRLALGAKLLKIKDADKTAR